MCSAACWSSAGARPCSAGSRYAGEHAHDSPVAIGLAVASMVVVALVLVRLLSVLLAFLQYHGFTLREDDARIRVERGLLARYR